MSTIAVSVVLLVLAAALAVISGSNDGGVLLAFAVRYPAVPLGWFALIVCATLVAGPLLLGTRVARTLTSGLFGTSDVSAAMFLIGTGLALIVVAVLSRLGLPTSLTLSLVGGLSGAALGCGLDVAWATIVRVLVIGAAAPLVGALAGWLLGAGLHTVTVRRRPPSAFRVVHVAGFLLQCLAYAVNDGQKMLAVVAVAIASLPGSVALLDPGHAPLLAGVLAALTVLFCVGMLSSVRRVSVRIASGLAVLRPADAVSAEFVGAAAVLGSSALGAPVSMTQTISGAVVGTAGSKGTRRVRWDSATRIVGAWLVTLPASGLGAFALAALVP